MQSWRWAPGERFIDDAVDVYEKVYPNLRVHDATTRPRGAASKIRWGNVEFDGDFSKDTPGSDLIALLLDDDPGPIYLLAWGGASTIARALKSIQEHYRAPEWPAIRAKVSRKAILSLSGDQDDTYAKYIRPNWPDIRSLPRGRAASASATARSCSRERRERALLQRRLDARNVSSQGPFGAHYRVWGDGKQMVQGRQLRLLRRAGASAALRAKGYVVWLPPRPRASSSARATPSPSST